MSVFLNFISRIEVLITIALLLVFLVVYLILRRIQFKKYKKRLSEFEVRYNTINSTPLALRLNKAIALARTDLNMSKQVANLKENFDSFSQQLKQITNTISDIDDQLAMGRLKSIKTEMEALEEIVFKSETDAQNLSNQLDNLLKEESDQLAAITKLRDSFRSIQDFANENRSKIAYSWITIEKMYENISRLFSLLEEWLYAGEYDKAERELADLKIAINRLNDLVTVLPDLLNDARFTVPQMAEEVAENYRKLLEKKVFLRHLNVEENINKVLMSLKIDLESLKNGETTDVKEHLETYKERLAQLFEALRLEAISYKEYQNVYQECTTVMKSVEGNIDYVEEQFSKVSVRLGLENLDELLKNSRESLKKAHAQFETIISALEADTAASSISVGEMKQIIDEMGALNQDILKMKNRLDGARNDEERAKRELLKLQLILNELLVKIRKNRMPSISEEFQTDLNKAYSYLKNLDGIISKSPLEVEMLNKLLKEAVDFISKLYNNVTNVVGIARLVEQTIVIGNRYRSSYPNVDSDLTRAELCYRNGEYTQALTIVIQAMEEVYPGFYEKLVRTNATA